MASSVFRRAISMVKPTTGVVSGRSCSSGSSYETLSVTRPSPFVVQVMLNRPEKSNAMNRAFWTEIKDCFDGLSVDPDCRVVMVTGAGKNFTGGLDLMDFTGQFSEFTTGNLDAGRRAMSIRRMVKPMQDSFTALEKCVKPVIAVIHGACIGGGVDLISACDIRIATAGAFFQIKEVDIGLAADVGTLQRLPKIIGNDSLLRDLVYTARRFSVEEALKMGMISNVLEDRESAVSAGLELAKIIASKSPVAIQGSKVNLVYSRDHPVETALEYAATWNSAMVQTEDIAKAIQAGMTKVVPVFSKL